MLAAILAPSTLLPAPSITGIRAEGQSGSSWVLQSPPVLVSWGSHATDHRQLKPQRFVRSRGHMSEMKVLQGCAHSEGARECPSCLFQLLGTPVSLGLWPQHDISVSVFMWLLSHHVTVSFSPSYKDTRLCIRPTVSQHDPILTNFICKDPIS